MDRGCRRWWAVVLVTVLAVAGASVQCRKKVEPVVPPPATQPASQAVGAVRQAAVAGLFYPNDPNTLSSTVDGLLAAANPSAVAGVRALVCPHAGYEFSGPVAAFGYKLLEGSGVRTAIVLAPSHYAEMTGAYVSPVEGYVTPLGTVRISPKAAVLAKAKGFADASIVRVHRPDWWRYSPQVLPAFGRDTPETWEHAAEVQVPFLQKVLGDFELVTVVVGEADPSVLADAIEEVLDDTTVVIASSDLSHYHSYEQAKAKDTRCVQAVCDLDLTEVSLQEACGRTPIQTVMHLAVRRGWRPRLLDYRNSGDTSGDKSRVVGYASIAFCTEEGTNSMTLSDTERTFLLDLARRTVQQAASGGKVATADPSGVTDRMRQPGACFVTLTKQGALRGCIGHLVPQMPLVEAVASNARSAAVEDYRFGPVKPAELDQIAIEISVLTVPQPLSFSSPEDLVSKLRPGRDGVILKIGSRMATYLPQVWKQIPDTQAFLSNLAEKAGCAADAWRGRNVEVLVYQVESFEEAKH